MGRLLVKASAPATIANLGPGFDVLGLALDFPRDLVTLEGKEEPGIKLAGSACAEEDNAVTIVLRYLLDLYEQPQLGLSVTLEKGMQVGTGMGSSAASAVAAAKALQGYLKLLTGVEISEHDMSKACLLSERRLAGGSTGDNCLPALLGGLVLIMSGRDLLYQRVPVPSGLSFVVVKPPVTVLTKEARAALPTSVSIAEMVSVASHTARVFSALSAGDFAGFAESVVSNVVQRAREAQIPHYEAAKQAALAAGALCFGVSGSGPSVFAAVLEDSRVAMQVSAAITSHFGEGSLTYFTKPDNTGARVELLRLEA
jgi:homoserine kinase